jgi:hypothetical protein
MRVRCPGTKEQAKLLAKEICKNSHKNVYVYSSIFDKWVFSHESQIDYDVCEELENFKHGILDEDFIVTVWETKYKTP